MSEPNAVLKKLSAHGCSGGDCIFCLAYDCIKSQQATITEQADIIDATREWLTKYAPELMPAYAVLLGEAHRKHAALKEKNDE